MLCLPCDNTKMHGGQRAQIVNTLYYGDNLDILRNHIADESVDLVYLDPPFNSNRDYNVLFAEKSGAASPAQMNAFTDTWRWDMAAESAMLDLAHTAPGEVVKIMEALRGAIGENELMAYLAMMAPRLVELHRVLKSTGSLYLHCDPTASHYLKIILDAVFGKDKFRSEINWRRTSAHSDGTQGRRNYGHVRDVILFYGKTNLLTWNPQFTPYSGTYVEQFYRHVDGQTGRRFRTDNLTAAKGGGDTSYEWRVKRPNADEGAWQGDMDEEYLAPRDDWAYRGVPPYRGRFWAYSRDNMNNFERTGRLHYSKSGMPNYKRYLDEMPGVPLQDDWQDIPAPYGNERLGYPTQKPIALLERIISASSNPGDVVLDPFCGCGTAIAAAEKLGRQWVGIDITYLAIAVMKQRFRDHFADEVVFDIIGDPQDAPSALRLFEDSPYQFQWWAVDKLGINARPFQGKKKGSDGGIDGEFFYSDERGRPVRGIIQIKGGKTGSRDVRDFLGTMTRESVDLGIFVSNQEPTADMRRDAAAAGLVESGWTGRQHPRIQLFTIEDLFAGKQPDIPYLQSAHARAPRLRKSEQSMTTLPMDGLQGRDTPATTRSDQ